jgi:hypothetical protein
MNLEITGMTFQAAKKLFDERFRFDPQDKPEACQAWCVFIDSLHREGKITDQQVQTWHNPFHT